MMQELSKYYGDFICKLIAPFRAVGDGGPYYFLQLQYPSIATSMPILSMGPLPLNLSHCKAFFPPTADALRVSHRNENSVLKNEKNRTGFRIYLPMIFFSHKT
jgi:hypothetical protein